MWPITVTVPLVPKSWNQMSRCHYRVRMREIEAWAKALEIAVPAIKKGIVFQAARDGKRMQVAITVRRRRLLDPDNTWLKGPLDAMRRCGYLQDDSPKFLELRSIVQICETPECTVISWRPIC